MTVPAVLDAAGRRRSPATIPGYHAGRAPRNKGQRYPADPPTVEEIVAVMREAGDDRHGWRLRGLIVVRDLPPHRRRFSLAVLPHVPGCPPGVVTTGLPAVFARLSDAACAATARRRLKPRSPR